MSGRRKVAVILAVSAGVVLLALSTWYSLDRSSEGRAATLADLRAADVLPDLVKGLPAGARDIAYYCHFHSGSGEAWFAIDAAEFLAWAESRGCQAERVSAEHPRWIGSTSVVLDRLVEDGYFWQREIDTDFYEKGLYDASSGRAYYICILGHYGGPIIKDPR